MEEGPVMIVGDVTTTDALVDEALELAEGLNRSLCYVQLKGFYNGSTGSILRGLHVRLAARGRLLLFLGASPRVDR